MMYHSISEHLEKRVHPYFQTSTSPRTFARQMKFLSDNGYKTIDLRQLSSYFSSIDHDHEKAVVLTFDDGFQDFYTEALPILARYDYNATVFLATDFIGTKTDRFQNRKCLTWGEVRDCQLAGVTFGSHTASHPQLSTLSIDDVALELATSKDVIEEKTGTSVESFSYPYAFPETEDRFTRDLLSILEGCGYCTGVTTTIGVTKGDDSRYFLKRLPANNFDDLRFYQAKIEGGYNWLHLLQYTKKSLSKWTNLSLLRLLRAYRSSRLFTSDNIIP